MKKIMVVSLLSFNALIHAAQENFEIYNKSDDNITAIVIDSNEIGSLKAQRGSGVERFVNWVAVGSYNLNPNYKKDIPKGKNWKLTIDTSKPVFIYIWPSQSKFNKELIETSFDGKFLKITAKKGGMKPVVFAIQPGTNNNIYLTWDNGKKDRNHPLRPETGVLFGKLGVTASGLWKGKNVEDNQIKYVR